MVAFCLGACVLPVQAERVVNVLTPYADRVDAAVEKALDHLASTQKEDGSYGERYGTSAAIPALCGMAFLSAGHTPGYPPYGENINRCIDYVLSLRDKSGYMGRLGGKMYGHNIAALFLLEVSGMVDDERQKKLDTAIPEAVKLILTAQQVEKKPQHQGGWRYHPTSSTSDLSCSGWALMALRSARLNGIPVPEKAIDDAVEYVRRMQHPAHGGFGYVAARRGTRITLAGVGLLCLELTGHHGDKATFRAGDRILNQYEKMAGLPHFIYGLYYASQGMFQLGGHYWERFAAWMYDYWIPKQLDDGSWPRGPKKKDAPGRAYVTSMTVLSFTVPYRQLPIYQRDETVDEEE